MQRLAEGRGTDRLRADRTSLVTHPIRGSASAHRQLHIPALLQLEQQTSGGHVLELAQRVAPVPKLSQLTTQMKTTPLWMLSQELAQLLQLLRTNATPLKHQTLGHAEQSAKRGSQSPEKNETFFETSPSLVTNCRERALPATQTKSKTTGR